jgi:hypothetical protein
MKNIIFIIIVLISNSLFAQTLVISNDDCIFSKNDLTITLSGWDIDRTDYDHATFTSVVGDNNLNALSYSGEKDTEEFSYPWFYYTDSNGENFIHFSGVLEGTNGTYQGQKMINSFKITSRNHFNVNGLRVGDPKIAVMTAFPQLCYKSDVNDIFLSYEWYTLSFTIDSNTNLISCISLYSPL